MYEYKSVKLGFKKQSAFKSMVIQELEDYHEIIDTYVKDGWRFVQILPVKFANAGYPIEFEIIFEREVL